MKGGRMRLRLEARPQPLQAMLWLSPLIAVVASVAASAVLFAALGRNPLVALYTMFIAPLGTVLGLTELALKATPLLLCAVGIAVGCRANVWNIGAEGQFTVGAICGGGVGLLWGDQPWVLVPMLMAGIAGGMAWAAMWRFRSWVGWCTGRGRIRMASTSRRPNSSRPRRRCRCWSRGRG
jgi:simple sugar transport system permease protein